jgi:cytochrome c peroxidase
MQGPLFAAAEMGTTPAQLLQTLNSSPAYRELFEVAFPGESDGAISLNRIYTALAAFEASLISLGSRYDRYANGDPAALSAPEIEGFNVFRSFVARCAECHTPPLFTNQQIAVIGVPDAEGRPFDPGAGAVFDNPTWRGGFKVPTLRNIATTAPYMHAGQFATLREAAKFYNEGRGHAVPTSEELALHWHIWNPELRDDELDRLVDFMNALTDETFTPAIPERVPSGLTPVGEDAPPPRSVKGFE